MIPVCPRLQGRGRKQGDGRKRAERGVSLIELLTATLILSLATLVIVQCVALASRHFVNQTREAEAQMLCSALVVAIQDELFYAQEVNESGAYFSGSRRQGQESSLTVDSTGGITRVVVAKGSTMIPLVEDASYATANRRSVTGTGGFLVPELTTVWANGQFHVTLAIKDADGEKTLAAAQFTVKPLAPGAEEAA